MQTVLCVTLRAPVASFRRPLDHNYQRTLPMPPPTTILGIAGAALGLADRALWAPDGPLRGIKVSVWMDEEPGRARDQWTLLKIKGSKMERSPYLRELLFFVRYTLVYGGDVAVLQRLRDAFVDPVYPLSLGREDELALVEAVDLAPARESEPVFTGTVLPGDIRQMPIGVRLREGIRFEPPTVETLPLRFEVDARGIRHPQDMKPLSFLPPGLTVEVSTLPAWECRERRFTWLNS
ncbi:MAG: CRISPR-associated protein Cas5 [Chloroflexota bacterium]